MPPALAGVPTAELIARGAPPDCDPDVRYQADWELIKRFRAGIDLPHLIALMQSDSLSGRSRAAFLIEEVAATHEALRQAVVGFADDPLTDCRRAFVKFVTDTRLYDATIADALAKCFHDRDLTVRLFSILWAIGAPTASFDHFCALVDTGAGLCLPTPRPSNQRLLGIWRAESLQRSARALAIARRVRSGESIPDIRATIAEEDSHVLHGLERFLDLRQDRQRISSARQLPAKE